MRRLFAPLNVLCGAACAEVLSAPRKYSLTSRQLFLRAYHFYHEPEELQNSLWTSWTLLDSWQRLPRTTHI